MLAAVDCDPACGSAVRQFLSRDPLVALTRSPYGYVAGNPLNMSDPTGLDGGAVMTGAGVVAGGAGAECAATWFIPIVDLDCLPDAVVAAGAGVVAAGALVYSSVAGAASWVPAGSQAQANAARQVGKWYDPRYDKQNKRQVQECDALFNQLISNLEKTGWPEKGPTPGGKFPWGRVGIAVGVTMGGRYRLGHTHQPRQREPAVIRIWRKSVHRISLLPPRNTLFPILGRAATSPLYGTAVSRLNALGQPQPVGVSRSCGD